MRTWSRYLAGVLAVTGVLALVPYAGAETCKLETKRVDTVVRTANGQRPVEYWFRSTRSQSFFMQIGGPKGMIGGPEQPGVPAFSKVIKKEPSEYNSESPFRGVAKLGSQYYGFVFDTSAKEDAVEDAAEKEQNDATAGAQKLMKTIAYERLYFDINHNGDLTDDEVIKAQAAQTLSASYINCRFPTVDLMIDLDGTEIEYAFTMSVYSNASTSYSYANASLAAGAYRDGEMVIDGKKYRIVVVDFNSNGRFDDLSKIDDSVRMSDGTVYPTIGDMLYVIDSEAKQSQGYVSSYDPSTNSSLHYVSKLVNLDGRYFSLAVSPSGDEVTLEPSSIPIGYVSNANKGYRAILYGEDGFLKIVGDESGKAPVPVGKWQLASYTIDKGEIEEPAQEKAEEGSWFDNIKRALTGTRPAVRQPRFTMVSARGKREYPAVEVAEGTTVELPFGGPFRPIVSVAYARSQGEVSLSMSLVGTADEVCTSLYVNSSRPGKPAFTITTEKGEVVDTGSFEYG